MPERYVAVKEEASYAPATAVVPDAADAILANRAEANMVDDVAFPTSMRGRGVYDVYEGYYAENVTMSLDVRPDNIGWFLKWLLGSVASAVQGATTAYKHTFKPADTIRSFAFGYNWDTLKEKRVAGCIMQNAKFTLARGSTPLIADFTAIGQTESLETVQSPTGWSTLAPFKPYQCSIEVDDTPMTGLIEGITINVNNKIYDIGDIGVLGSRKLPRIELGERKITGTLNIPILSSTLDLYERFLEDSGATEPGEPLVPFKLEALIDTGIVADTGYNYALDFTLPEIILTSAPPPMEKQERKRITLGWQAKYNSGISAEMQVDLTNLDTAYPDAT